MRVYPRVALLMSALCVLACAPVGPRPSPALVALAALPRLAEARVSPDGATVAYVSDQSGTPELWTVPAAGGAPRRLTHLKERVEGLRFAPDGLAVFASTDVGGNELYDLLRVPLVGSHTFITRTPARSELQPAPSPDGRRLAYLADPVARFQHNLFVRDLASGLERPLTTGEPPAVGPVWSRDGRFIALARSADQQKGHLVIVDVTTGDTARVEPPQGGGILWPKVFLGDGRLLVTTRNAAGFLQLAVVSRVGEGAPTVTRVGPGEWDVEEAVWDARRGISFLRNEGGASALWTMTSPEAPPARVSQSRGVMRELSVSGPRLVYIEDAADRASRIRAWEDGRARDVLPAPPGPPLGKAELIAYPSDEHTIHALLVRPTTPALGTPPPCAVWIKGGPEGQVRPSMLIYIQALAQAGFTVLAPNYRGATGFGQRFTDANNKDWAGGDLRDVAAGVDHLAARGVIDKARTVVLGHSYGGYLTLMALALQPERWRAGVDLYGMADLVEDYELTKARYGVWYETEMGTPQTHAALFKERSPLTHLRRIRAPLLVMHGVNDVNVPKVASERVVQQLRARRHPVELVMYPGEGHDFQRRDTLVDAAARAVAFLSRHVLRGR